MTTRISLSLVTALLVHTTVPQGAALARASGTAAASAAIHAPASQPEKLDTLLAPIALYPDALILQILQCAPAPDQLRKLNDWIKTNPDVKGTAAQDAIAAEGYEMDFVAIVLFPAIVKRMVDEAAWTRDIAAAFTSDRAGVFASIQRLREQARSMGNLATNEQQSVETVTTGSGTEVIVIQPANPQVVYVPQYNPTVVYTQPPPPPSNDQAVAAGLLGFGVGVIIGAAIADDNDSYYGCGGWGYRGGMCEEGWEDYYDHRENMANDYYEHRENMSAQRGENQGQRQDKRTENQTTREASRTENQTGRQDTRTENQTGRQDSRGTGQSSASGQAAGGKQAQGGTASSSGKGASKGSAVTPSTRAGTNSGAFSGYQKGSSERQASSRGQSSASSASRSSGGSRGGGGGSRGGGGGRGR